MVEGGEWYYEIVGRDALYDAIIEVGDPADGLVVARRR